MTREPEFVLCVRNEGCDDLESRKAYQIILDQTAGKDGYLRVIDDSGEDYLYPRDSFLPLPLPSNVERELENVALSRSRG